MRNALKLGFERRRRKERLSLKLPQNGAQEIKKRCFPGKQNLNLKIIPTDGTDKNTLVQIATIFREHFIVAKCEISFRSTFFYFSLKFWRSNKVYLKIHYTFECILAHF